MRISVILSGCGVRDGSEIHEAVLLLLALDQAGHSVSIFAPDKAQADVVNHATGRQMAEKRQVLVEAARIARGKIRPLSELDVSACDAIVLPGGMGAVKNLCNFAEAGMQCDVDELVASKLRLAHQNGKILGFMCIAPVIAARLFGESHVHVTIGDDEATAHQIEATGAVHEVHRANEACIDSTHKIVTTPAYMNARCISDVYASAQALVAGIEKL
jgi:enhancing lycopene biosynthesis protein 2